MTKWRFNGSWTLALLIIAGSFHPANAAPIDELIAGAKKEGVIELYAPSTLTPQGAQRLGEAFNKQYGLNLKLNFSPSGSMTRDVGKMSESQPPDCRKNGTSCWCMMAATPLSG